ncbi:MAG: lipopolysaccharide heptosyltransferase II [Ignavibacteriales bacterium]|nr:lipopolysaccharide heptosyltransferase II [Ignavibacteriales bacterium]
MLTPQKILIIRLSSLGDVILTSPVVRCLRKTFPSAQIDFLIKSEYADLYRFNPNISSLIELKSADPDELKSLKQKITRTRYDIIIDLHNSLRSRYIRFLSMSRYTRVINKKILKRLLLVKFGVNLFGDNESVVDRYFKTVEKFGVINDIQGLEIFIPDEVREITKTLAEQLNLSRYQNIFGFVPSAKHFTKRWLPERFVELGIRLSRDYKSKILIFGGKDEQEYCDDISQMIDSRSGANVSDNLAGKLNLLETAATLDYCNLIITNDSGLMHLATARKKKVVAIFGSTVKHLGFAPSGTESSVVEAVSVKCRPCSHIGRSECPKKHFNCMKKITVEMMISEVHKLMSV